jgi:hypothetical protein
MYRVNVSSVQDFMQCRFRWWCKWIKNRVPVADAPALEAGRILHRAFEDHFANGTPLGFALTVQCAEFRKLIPTAHLASQPNAWKALQSMEDLIPAMPLWHDRFPVDEVIAVEQPFEYRDPVDVDILWIGRPDREVRSGKRRLHVQNRGLASGQNFGTYLRLQQRSYHEHLYAEARGLSGTVFNLVRKLKFHTNVGKKNEKTKTAAEMFFQGLMGITLNSPIHRSVMSTLRQHVNEMRRVEQEWLDFGDIPAPNDKMNGGYGGNSEDSFFKVLIGEIRLDDDNYFKAREDTYAVTE